MIQNGAAPAAGVKPAVLQNRFYADSGYDVELRAFCKENGVVYQSFWTLTANRDIIWGGDAKGGGTGRAKAKARRCRLKSVFASTESDIIGDSVSDSTPVCVAL